MIEAPSGEDLLEDLANQRGVKSDVQEADVLSVYNTHMECVMTEDLAIEVNTDSDGYYKHKDEAEEIDKSDITSPEIIPDGFEEETYVYNTYLGTRECGRCKGNGYIVCNCSRDGCDRCGDSGTIACNCNNGTISSWTKGSVQFKIVPDGLSTSSTGTPFSPELYVDIDWDAKEEDGALESENIEMNTISTRGGFPDPAEGTNVIKTRTRVFELPSSHLAFEYDGTQYDAYRIDGEWTFDTDDRLPVFTLPERGRRFYAANKGTLYFCLFVIAVVWFFFL